MTSKLENNETACVWHQCNPILEDWGAESFSKTNLPLAIQIFASFSLIKTLVSLGDLN